MDKIAVITPSKFLFNAWLFENSNIQEYKNYQMVNSSDHCRGVHFQKVIHGHNSEEVDNDVVKLAKARVR